MKKILLPFIFCILFFAGSAQPKKFYVAYSSGVNIRESASLTAKLLGKIPYGTKLETDVYARSGKEEIVENMTGKWAEVTYQNKKGYILDCYLSSWPPPKKGTKTLADYLLQITKKFGARLEYSRPNSDAATMDGNKFYKQLYANGVARHEMEAIEFYSDTYYLPNLQLTEAFILLRQIGDYKNMFTEKDAFFIKSEKRKIKIDNNETDLDIQVEKEPGAEPNQIKKLTIDFEMGAFHHLELFYQEGHVVVLYNNGV
jgi:Bacterial SH3 domain